MISRSKMTVNGPHREFRKFIVKGLTYFKFFCYTPTHHGVLAKLVIALACHAGDHGFESRTSRLSPIISMGFFIVYSGNSAAGSALGSGLRGPRFESGLPEIKKATHTSRFFYLNENCRKTVFFYNSRVTYNGKGIWFFSNSSVRNTDCFFGYFLLFFLLLFTVSFFLLIR